jgi:hypothetical protein
MNAWQKKQIEQAARWGDEEALCEAAETLWNKSDYEEVKEIIRAKANKIHYAEFGNTMFFGDVEIDQFGIHCQKERR